MRRAPTLVPVLAAVLIGAGCRGEAPRAPADETPDVRMARIVDSLRPAVERAMGVPFKSVPRSAMRSREQLRRYLVGKLEEPEQEARTRQSETVYHLLGLLPDSVRLKAVLLDVLTEQVAGYYDPDSAMLFGVTGQDESRTLQTLAHEMVHALQAQYVRVDSILDDVRDADRLAAARAVLEGEATVAQIRMLQPNVDLAQLGEAWSLMRGQLKEVQSTMPAFARAPFVLREELLFPYLSGGEFMRWWETTPLRDSLPYGPRMPRSTEQILHPDRYLSGDAPVSVSIDSTGDGSDDLDDVLGDLSVRLLTGALRGSPEPPLAAPSGWGGDRYRVLETPEGPALIWFVVWDNPAVARRFVDGTGAALLAREREGYRDALEAITLDGRAVTRYVTAPAGWAGWAALPGARIGAR